MSENLERTIRNLLLDEGNSDRVADNLLHRLRIESPGLKQREAFLAFIVNAGFAKYAMELYNIWFTEKRRIPFYPFCRILEDNGFQPKPEFFKHLLKANASAEESSPILYFTPWEEREPAFARLKQASVDQIRQDAKEHYRQQLAKLDYLRLNRMIDEEQALLDQMLFAHPDDAELLRQKENLQSRWAEAVITRRAGLPPFEAGYEKTELQLTALELKALSTIADGLLAAAKKYAEDKNSQMPYMIAVALYMLELYNPAIEALQSAERNVATDWLIVECLLKSRRFVETLDAVITIEGTYKDDPETTFGATYARALALEGLGQKAAAAELVQSILNVRPSYRSVQALQRRLLGRGMV